MEPASSATWFGPAAGLESDMLPMDPLTAFDQAKATMAQRQQAAASSRMARAARTTRARRFDGTAVRQIAHGIAAAVGHLRGAAARRAHARRPEA
jgi:hypothetical protein